MIWRTQFDKHERFYSNVGSRYQDIYHPVIDSTGHYELEIDPDQKTDIYAEIQSHKDSVDLKKILARYQAGDIGAISKVQGVYGDLTSVPKNVFEFMNMMQRNREYFNQLPVNIKESFGNSFEQFAITAGSDEWFSKMTVKKEDIVSDVKEEGVSE